MCNLDTWTVIYMVEWEFGFTFEDVDMIFLLSIFAINLCGKNV